MMYHVCKHSSYFMPLFQDQTLIIKAPCQFFASVHIQECIFMLICVCVASVGSIDLCSLCIVRSVWYVWASYMVGLS